MKNLKNPFFITGVIAFLIIAGLAWNYTEAIKAKNEIEQERMANEADKKYWDAIKSANFQAAYIECLKEAQEEYDRTVTEFGDGPREKMESKKQDCERLYDLK